MQKNTAIRAIEGRRFIIVELLDSGFDFCLITEAKSALPVRSDAIQMIDGA